MPNRSARRTRKKPQPRSFRPTTAMHRYLAAEKGLLARRRPFTQKMVAELAQV
jgi:hypothetical protein